MQSIPRMYMENFQQPTQNTYGMQHIIYVKQAKLLIESHETRSTYNNRVLSLSHSFHLCVRSKYIWKHKTRIKKRKPVE